MVSRQRLYQLEFPDRHAARAAVRHLVVTGGMLRPESYRCVDCGARAQEYDHYLGYEERFRLCVQPVCRSCHGKRPRIGRQRVCQECSAIFVALRPQRYCSDECKAIVSLRARIERRKRLEAKREIICDECGQTVSIEARRRGFRANFCTQQCFNRNRQRVRNTVRRWNGAVLRDARQSHGLSQQQLADALGLAKTGQGHVAHWEKGIDPPNERHWPALERVIGLTADQIRAATFCQPEAIAS